jgi:hypothetical protein
VVSSIFGRECREDCRSVFEMTSVEGRLTSSGYVGVRRSFDISSTSPNLPKLYYSKFKFRMSFN